MGFFGELIEQFRILFDGMAFSKKLSLLLVFTLTIGGFVGLFWWSSRPNFQAIYRGLDPDDAGAIIDKLRSQKIPFKLSSSGSTILVPAERRAELRLQLASEGFPRSGDVGFEIFDKTSFGVTEFVQKLNYRRALQGELARTIKQLDTVERVRVHIVVPEPSIFVRDQRDARASVILHMAPSKKLGRKQVAGIVHLVASSVEGLKASNVTIVNQEGVILAGGQSEDGEEGAITSNQLDMQAELERKLERHVVSMLGRVIGPSKVIARVAVELKTQRIERTEERYDPDQVVVRSEQRTTEESSGGRGGASGAPGVDSNVPSARDKANGPGRSAGKQFKRQNETLNYEISRTIQRIVESPGEIKRLSVAVLVDGRDPAPGSAPGSTQGESSNTEDQAPSFIPRSRDEMKKFEDIVKRTVGFDEKRGDNISLVNVQFQPRKTTRLEEQGVAPETLPDRFGPYLNYLFSGIVIIFLFLFVLRPLLAWLARTNQEIELIQQLPKSIGDLEIELALPSPESQRKQLAAREQVQEFVRDKPEITTQLLKTWMREGSGQHGGS